MLIFTAAWRSVPLIFLAWATVAAAAQPKADESTELTVRHTPIAALGGEHIAHAIHRRSSVGGSIVGWANRRGDHPKHRPPSRRHHRIYVLRRLGRRGISLVGPASAWVRGQIG